jgi:hypothetical protein
MDSSKENIVYYNKLAMTKKPCKLIGNIKWILLEDIYWNVWPVYNINLKLNNNNNDFTIKSYWVTNYWDMRFDWQIPWLFVKINWKNYNPKVWDYLIAKVNPDNHYIIELFPTEWKSVLQMNKEIDNLGIPYCTWKQLTQDNNKSQINYFDNNLFVWLLIWIILCTIFTLIYKKIKKSKK